MDVIPAIDLLDGRCVRLYQGDYAQSQVFAADPVAVAQRWQAQGASWLHLVDLDGAKTGATGESRQRSPTLCKRLRFPFRWAGGCGIVIASQNSST